MGKLIDKISSYDTNIMVAAIISLLLVILFVLLLHIYARFFLSFSRLSPPQTTPSSVVSVSYSLTPSTFHHSPSKGLPPSLVSSIPLFTFKEEEQQPDLECAICLSVFEASETGRRLNKCGHGFHVQCIDMWLHSHSNCPICRAPAAECANQDDAIVVAVQNDNSSAATASTSSSSPSSLKRMLSRNRSEGCKVFPSHVNTDQSLGVSHTQIQTLHLVTLN